MIEEVDLASSKLEAALKYLNEGIQIAKNDLERDGVLRRFGLLVDGLCKTIKVYLENRDKLCTTPKDCLKAAFRYGLIKDEKIYLDMLRDRNRSSHLYSKVQARRS